MRETLRNDTPASLDCRNISVDPKRCLILSHPMSAPRIVALWTRSSAVRLSSARYGEETSERRGEGRECEAGVAALDEPRWR